MRCERPGPRGSQPSRVLIKHVLRVSLIPIVSLWGLDFAAVIGGATLIVESVFNLNGIGQYAAHSVGRWTCRRCSSSTLLGACFVIFMNAVVDVLYAVLDPRIRVASS